MFRKSGLLTNRWLAIGEPKTIFVCAGANPADPAQGWVFVHYYSADNSFALPDREQPAVWFYPTPEKTGSVRIVGAVGGVLTLQSDGGRLYFFDAEALRYVDPPKPEATPGPR